jgi:hypothetical protein
VIPYTWELSYAAEIAKKHRESEKGIRLEYFKRRLNCIDIELLDYYDYINCCSKQNLDTLNFKVDPMKNMLSMMMLSFMRVLYYS